ncbi:MAG: hypothetical protein AAGG11_03085 [Pseudomonadota bacterium]
MDIHLRLTRRSFQRLFIAAALIGGWSGIAVADFAGDYHDEDSGYIERLDFTAGTAVIGGLTYRMAPALKVEINNSYGAFTMLKKGMFVRVLYLEHIDNDRQVVFIEELTNASEWEET